MSNNQLIYYKIQKMISSYTKINNIYEHDDMVKFYNNITNQSSFNNDISFYKKKLDKSKFIIELASGSGRVLTELVDDGFNVTGIEYESAMINSMPLKYHEYVIQSDIFDFNTLSPLYQKVDSLILPATSITLFSLEKFENLLKNIMQLNKKFNIIFDFYNIEDLITESPKKVLNENGTFYSINFKNHNNFIYNLYHKEKDILGISVKYAHSLDNLVSLLNRINMEVNVVPITQSYYMIEGTYNEK